MGYGLAESRRKLRWRPGGQDPLAAAERERIQRQVELVDEIVLEQHRHQLAAAIGHDVLARLGLERPDRLDDVVADDRRVAPDRLLKRARHDVLLRRVHEVAERIARRHRLEGSRMGLIGAPAQEEGIDVLHRLEEGDADVVVPVRDGPAAVGEAPVAILVLAARGLHHAVEAHELVHDQLAHSVFLCRQSPVASR